MRKIKDVLIGSYDLNINYSWMFGSYNLVIKNYNLITDAGRTLILNRLGSNTTNPISAIAIGTGTNVPLQANTTLQTETVRKATGTPTIVGTPNWLATFAAIFSSSEINGTTEVGLLNSTTTGGVLATRSTHLAIALPAGSTVSFEYALGLLTGKIMNTFVLTTGQTNTYEIPNINVPITGVIEKDTNNGYAKKTTIAGVESNPGSYYYDGTAKILYIHTTNSANPNTHSIMAIFGD